MSGIMPITDLLMSHFDKLKRDKNGTIVYDEQLKEITNQNHPLNGWFEKAL